jgi:protein N-terminal methyltransferase
MLFDRYFCHHDLFLSAGLEKWKKIGNDYWANTPATLDGVLGGFPQISLTDLRGSEKFLSELGMDNGVAADVGAGIGRVVEGLLAPMFGRVDLVEPNPAFVEEARQRLRTKTNIFYHVQTLQDFSPAPNTYDMVMAQWVLGHLPDKLFITFLEKSARALKPRGVLFFKENVSNGGFYMDREDGCLGRSMDHFLELFAAAGLRFRSTVLSQYFYLFI